MKRLGANAPCPEGYPAYLQAGTNHENNVFPSPLTGEGGDEGGTSCVSPSPQSSPPVEGEEVFGVIFYISNPEKETL